MGNTRKNKGTIKGKTMKALNKTLPVVDEGLKKVGTTAKDVAESSIPIIEKGVSRVYGTMATGLDLGVQGVEAVSSKFKNRSRNISRGLSRGRTLSLSRGFSRGLARGRSLARTRSRGRSLARAKSGGRH